MKAAVIGLGSMGWGAAVSLLRAGIDTSGCDVIEETLERFAQAGGRAAQTPGEAAQDADVIFVFVVNAQQAESVLFGSRGAVSAAPLGAVFVLCATIPPAEAIRIAADLTAAGMAVIDAPVSGGAAKSEAGELTIIASGKPAAFDKARAALEAVSTKIFRLGDAPGTGSKLKMINQLLAGVHIASMAEAMVLATREGLDLQTVYDVICDSAGGSWMFENRAPQVVNGDYTAFSAVDIFVKDLGIVRQTAGDTELPITQAALKLFQDASAAGLGREADAAVAKVLAQRAGVKLP